MQVFNSPLTLQRDCSRNILRPAKQMHGVALRLSGFSICKTDYLALAGPYQSLKRANLIVKSIRSCQGQCSHRTLKEREHSEAAVLVHKLFEMLGLKLPHLISSTYLACPRNLFILPSNFTSFTVFKKHCSVRALSNPNLLHSLNHS